MKKYLTVILLLVTLAVACIDSSGNGSNEILKTHIYTDDCVFYDGQIEGWFLSKHFTCITAK